MSKHQLWNELGNVYINSNAFEEAIQAYRKAIDISPDFGWAYNNMALAYMRLGQPEISIPYYQRSIELLSEFKDKAVAWHRMGNSYQVMDDIENAVLAFQRAVNLDLDNTKYRHDLAVAKAEYAYEEEEIKDEELELAEEETKAVAEEQETEPLDEAVVEEENEEEGSYSSWIEKTIEKLTKKALKKKAAAFEYETIVFPEGVVPEEAVAELMSLVEGQSVETLLSEDEKPAEEESKVEELPELEIEEEIAEELFLEEESKIEELPELEIEEEQVVEAPLSEEESLKDEKDSIEELSVLEVDADEAVEELSDEDSGGVETQALEIEVADEEVEAVAVVAEEKEEVDALEQVEAIQISAPPVPAAIAKDLIPAFASVEDEELDAGLQNLMSEISQEIDVDEKGSEDVLLEEETFFVSEQEEEFLDEIAEEIEENIVEEVSAQEVVEESIEELEEEPQEEALFENDGVLLENSEEVAKEESLFNQIVSDNGNGNGNGNGSTSSISSARVWSELGNVFYKEGIFDGAQIAYKKAIELDNKFGLAFNNLALLHVHDGEYEEAVQLYETSIDLIENNTAQAVTWNNLGNAHRALKAYEEAEKAYRKADDLVGEKIAIESSTRYGLLDDTSSS
ncbi:MAG: tetratricopeptide repeat protein [Chloroflexi bacterium]|nr:tetratricopeptide repeat protein [Chloroflexota bacterium]